MMKDQDRTRLATAKQPRDSGHMTLNVMQKDPPRAPCAASSSAPAGIRISHQATGTILNAIALAWGADYLAHMAQAGFDRWIEPGPLMIVVGPNAGGKSTVIDLFRALANARLWPGLQRETIRRRFLRLDIEGAEYNLSARFSKYTPEVPKQMFDWATIIAVAQRGPNGRSESVLASKYGDAGDWVFHCKA